MVMERFGFEREMSMAAVQERLKELEATIRRRILKEIKIREGAENMRRATNDKKSLAHVRTIVNEVNDTLQNLNQELNDVRTYLQMTSDDSDPAATTGKRPGTAHLCTGLEKNLGFLEKVFRFLGFLDFSVEIRLDTKFPHRKNILYTIHSVRAFSVKYNKTHKS